jgi:hypothetical protein
MRRAKRQNAQTNPSDASVEFRDLERHRWHFFLHSPAATNGANDATLPEGFGNALNAAGAWLGWQGTLLRHDRRPTPADYSQRLVVEQATELARTRRDTPHPGGAHAAGRLLPADGCGDGRRAPEPARA